GSPSARDVLRFQRGLGRAGMEDLHYRLIERLRQDPRALSRNRNFHAFDDPSLLRARRVFRLLRSIERDLLACGQGGGVHVAAEGRLVKISVSLGSVSGTRTAFLHPREFDLLLSNPDIREILLAAG